MSRLILIRHGQSEWNKQNIFTGWIDIPLSLKGVEEAFAAGNQIADFPIDLIFTSELIRGIMTAMLVMNVHGSGKVPVIVHPDKKGFEGWQKCHSQKTEESLIPVVCAWELNERMYGQLQGMNKDEMRAKFGEEQVQIWRRSFDVPPPDGESLKMTSERTLPYFRKEVMPRLKEGKNVMITAHGNSLRSIVMDLEKLSGEQVIELEIATGKPLIYDYTPQGIVRVQ
jgi:2,3-bisphosphoglycerate-dependent phosphoglycerate mutase